MRKVERKSHANPFDEIKDFAGVRVISYYNDDVDRIAIILNSELDVDPAHSMDKISNLDIDEFGYRPFHLVCKLKEPRIALPEWKRFSGLTIEIQVRSVLQHAWAAISHKLVERFVIKMSYRPKGDIF